MQPAALAVAEDAGEFEDLLFARRQQFLGGEFRRGVQVKRAAGCRPARCRLVSKACRWASLPGEATRAPHSTSVKPSSSKQAREPRLDPAPAGPAGAGGRHGSGAPPRHLSDQGRLPAKDPPNIPRFERFSRGFGYRQLRAQRQCPGEGRQALSGPDRREYPSRQGHARHPSGNAPHQRWREDGRTAAHHRQRRKGFRRAPGLSIICTRTATITCSCSRRPSTSCMSARTWSATARPI